jgi:tRNA dimethylallyltransferase
MPTPSKFPTDWILPPLEDVLYLTGPTASGKTQIAVELADALAKKSSLVEIISVDSMAIYRGMDIGTAKPSPQIRQQVTHHLIDIVDPTQDYSVSQFLNDAHAKVAEIQSRGKRPLLVGGTPLYLKSLICGFFQGPPADWEFRKAVEQEVQSVGTQALYERLQQVDPLSAHRILPGDTRRMIRALEVSKITGKPFSHWQTQFERFVVPNNSQAFVLGWDRPTLHRRVETRVEQMLEQGLVEEVKELKERFGNLGRTASQAVGYKEPLEHLAGAISWREMKDKITAHTRQFVRRQEIWFRSMPGLRRIDMNESLEPRSVAEQILLALEYR